MPCGDSILWYFIVFATTCFHSSAHHTNGASVLCLPNQAGLTNSAQLVGLRRPRTSKVHFTIKQRVDDNFIRKSSLSWPKISVIRSLVVPSLLPPSALISNFSCCLQLLSSTQGRALKKPRLFHSTPFLLKTNNKLVGPVSCKQNTARTTSANAYQHILPTKLVIRITQTTSQ